jgi:mandelamide amidase
MIGNVKMKRREFLASSAQLFGGAMISTVLPAAPAGASQNLTELSAAAAVDAMRKGDIKAEDYAAVLLGRVKQLESLNAFRTLEPDKLLEAARDADKARASGRSLGLLHGLPIPVKDSVNTKALPTSNGTRALKDFRPKDDASVLKALFAQGALTMGKTNLHELSFGWTSNNGVFGPVRNPYSSAHIPGGSSGGSGAAVASRMAPLAIAEDTLGSIRVPASACGLAGLRPTFGRYPDDGIMPLTENKFDQVGPLARSVADLALFDAAVTGDVRPLTATPLKGVRVGTAPYFIAGLDPDVDRVMKAAVERLKAAGAVIVEADIPDAVKVASDIAFTIIGYETVPSISQFLTEQGTGLTFEQMLGQASEGLQGVMKAFALPPNRPAKEAYDAMLLKRDQLKEAIRRYFDEQGVAALALPAIMIPPPKIGEEVEVIVQGQKLPLLVAMGRNVSPGSCASLASLVLPAGLSGGGLPIGIEFDAPAGKDRELLALGLSLEAALGAIPAPKL